jgi:hypothetical protein
MVMQETNNIKRQLSENSPGRFLDVPIVKLVPLKKRKINKQAFNRISASIQKHDLIAPLLVYPENSHYIILDGHQRYMILLELGIETVPCAIWNQKEAFSSNRMVNHLSAVQENRMIEKALTELDEVTIAETFGLNRISHRQNKALLKQLHSEVAIALDKNKITKACAKELTYVTTERQAEILKAMKQYNDYSIVFIRNLILKTPSKQRSRKRAGTQNPWMQKGQNKNSLMKKFQEAERKHDFYSRLYQQYSIDLLKLVIYVRSLINTPRIREYLQTHHVKVLTCFENIVADAEAR